MNNYQSEKEGILKYLHDLTANNDRDWFNENKAEYTSRRKEFDSIIKDVSEQIALFDKSFIPDKVSNYIFRIYRDVRFSKNKLPYKNHFAAYMSNGGRKSVGAGYYLHIEPENIFIGGGIHMPQGEILKAIRKEIYFSFDKYKSLKNKSKFKSIYSQFDREKLKRPPIGFPKDHESIEDLKNKSFAFGHTFSEEEFLKEDFFENLISNFKILKPINDFFNEAIEM